MARGSKTKPSFELSEELRYLQQNNLVHGDQPTAALAFQQAFEKIGGVQRMALWADRYPASFFKLYARMVIPTITPVLPKPEEAEQVWPEWLSQRRLAYQEGAVVDQEDDGMASTDDA